MGEFNRINWADFVGVEPGDGGDAGGVQCGGFVSLGDGDVHIEAGGDDADPLADDGGDAADAVAENQTRAIIIAQRDKMKKQYLQSVLSQGCIYRVPQAGSEPLTFQILRMVQKS